MSDTSTGGSERWRYKLAWAIMPTDRLTVNNLVGEALTGHNLSNEPDDYFGERVPEALDKLRDELGVESRTLDTDNRPEESP